MGITRPAQLTFPQAKAEDAASAAAERPALPLETESSRLGGAQIHPADEYFTWGEGGARGSVEDFMKERVLKGSVYVGRKQKSQGKDRPRATSNQKENIPDPKRRSPDFLGRRAGSWHVRSLATPTP